MKASRNRKAAVEEKLPASGGIQTHDPLTNAHEVLDRPLCFTNNKGWALCTK